MSQEQNTSNEYSLAFFKFFLIGMILGFFAFLQEIIIDRDWEFFLDWILYVGILICGLLIGLVGIFIIFWGKRQRRKALDRKPLLQFREEGFEVFKENIYGMYKGRLVIIAYVVQAPKFPQPAIAIRIPHQFVVISSNIETGLNAHAFFRNKIEVRSNCLTYYAVYNFRKPSYKKLIARMDILLEELEKNGRFSNQKFTTEEIVNWLYIPNTNVENLSTSHG